MIADSKRQGSVKRCQAIAMSSKMTTASIHYFSCGVLEPRRVACLRFFLPQTLHQRSTPFYTRIKQRTITTWTLHLTSLRTLAYQPER